MTIISPGNQPYYDSSTIIMRDSAHFILCPDYLKTVKMKYAIKHGEQMPFLNSLLRDF